MPKFTEEQLQAINEEGKNIIVSAGAGSGKTRTLTYRVANLIDHGVEPYHIIALTFTNKAASEMKARVKNLTGFDLPMSGTFHSLSCKILRQYGPAIKIPNNFTIYDSDDQLALLKQLYRRNGWDAKTYKPQAVRAAISDAKNKLLEPEAYRQQADGDWRRFVADAYTSYQMNYRRFLSWLCSSGN